jgi:hypothetical protein
VSDPIASLTAEVERLAGLLRDANAEIVRLRGDAPTEPDRSTWPVLVADRGGRYSWPDGNPAVMPSGEREDTFRAVVDGSCGDVFYASAQAAADAIEARLPEEVAPKPPPTTDPPKLLIGMVVENEPGNAWLVGGTGSALMPHATAIYDSIADYRAGRALWRR